MKSLRGRLIGWLLGGTGLLLAGGGSLLDWTLRMQAWRDFDARLMTEARAMMAVTEQEGNALTVELSPGLLPEFDAHAVRPYYYQVWVAGGRVLARSPSLGAGNLPHLASAAAAAGRPVFTDLTLPDGRPGRYVQITFQPQIEPDDLLALHGRPPPSPLTATLGVARGRDVLQGFLRRFHWTLALCCAGLLAGSALLVWLVAQVALRPLDELASRLQRIDAASLAQPVAVAGAPAELAPTIAHLNGLLARLAASFERERTFSANVAHELRTPLAEIRTIGEVALAWQGDDAPALRRALDEIHQAGRQMERVVVHLLALARCDGGQQSVHPSPVDLRAAVERAWRTAAAEARQHAATAVLAVPAGLVVVTDGEKLELILGNLFANAIAYGVAGRPVTCTAAIRGGGGGAADAGAGAGGDGFELSVSNHAEGLTGADLPHLYERFWRKDTARSDGNHAGLGLSLVAALCELLGFSHRAILRDGMFQIVIAGPCRIDC